MYNFFFWSKNWLGRSLLQPKHDVVLGLTLRLTRIALSFGLSFLDACPFFVASCRDFFAFFSFRLVAAVNFFF